VSIVESPSTFGGGVFVEHIICCIFCLTICDILLLKCTTAFVGYLFSNLHPNMMPNIEYSVIVFVRWIPQYCEL